MVADGSFCSFGAARYKKPPGTRYIAQEDARADDSMLVCEFVFSWSASRADACRWSPRAFSARDSVMPLIVYLPTQLVRDE